jgi:hypothetical protein
MSDRDVLEFPGTTPDDEQNEAALSRRFATLYASTPATEAAQISRCIEAVQTKVVRGAPLAYAAPSRWWLIGAVAAVAAIAVTVKPWTVRLPDTGSDSAVAATVTRGNITFLEKDGVRFDLQLPGAAKEVAIVGDFNGWDEHATPMSRASQDRSWSASIPLAPGRHVYAFVVDGERWVVDPLAPRVPDEGLGPANAVVVEGLPK